MEVFCIYFGIACIIVIIINIIQDIENKKLKKEIVELEEKCSNKDEMIKKIYEDTNYRIIKEKEKANKQKKKVDELDGLLKAIITKFGNNEFRIDISEIEKAKRGILYIENSFMEEQKRIKVLFKENYLKEDYISNDNT